MLWRLLRPYLGPRSGLIVLIVVMLVGQSLGNLYLPNLNADLINRGIVEGNLGYIWATGAEMLAVTLAISAVAIIGVYWASRVSMSVGADLRRDVFAAVQAFSLRDMGDFGTPSLITRNTNDVQQIQMVLQISLTMMVVAPIMMVGGMIFAIREGARLLPLLAVAVPLMVVFLAIMMSRVVPQFRVMQVKIDRITQVLRDQITGVRVVRAFVRGSDEVRRFDEANADLTATTLSVNRLFALMMPTMMAILNLTSVAVMWFGGRLAAEGSVSIGNLTAVLSYILQILIAVMMATMLAIMVPRAMASAERIAQVLAATPSIADPPAARRPAHVDGAVELAGVHFRYPGSERAVLEDVTVHVAPGQFSAV
ncbi:MAG: ABC transporter permease, partial [Acidimicrobiales bacterium]